MPTRNREKFLPAAIDCFLNQTYGNKELIISYDAKAEIYLWYLPQNIITYHCSDAIRLGKKRNLCCEMAHGSIICHWDDDDWSSPERIEYQVKMLHESEKPVTGFSSMFFWDVINRQAKQWNAELPGDVCGTSLCYLKEYWRNNQFPDIAAKEDNAFVKNARRQDCIKASSDNRMMVARIHPGQTSGKDNIDAVVPREMIPTEFWENERIRIGHE